VLQHRVVAQLERLPLLWIVYCPLYGRKAGHMIPVTV